MGYNINMSEETVKKYIEYVQDTIKKFSKIGDLIQNNEISPSRLNKALGQYYDISLALNAEYQRNKIEHSALETEYQIWYDECFEQAKNIVRNEYSESRSIKPSLKEYETTLRRHFRTEWKEWDIRIKESEAKVQFLLRLRETLNKYDNILTAISYNMRSEMKALSIEDRSNANPESVQQNKYRSRFPVN